jgi:proline racemase
MLRVRDYTRLSPGTKFGGSYTQACEHCGKNGLVEEVNGKKWFTHSETIGFDSHGDPVMAWETCPPLAARKTLE